MRAEENPNHPSTEHHEWLPSLDRRAALRMLSMTALAGVEIGRASCRERV